MSPFFYIVITVFGVSFLALVIIMSVKIREARSGKLLFSRRIFEKTDRKVLNFFKSFDLLIKRIALMSARRRMSKFLGIGKLKHFFNKFKNR